jgi:hypothetical protein
MKPEEINRAIAEVCGVHYHRPTEEEIKRGSYYQYEPDYCGNLNTMHEAEKFLNPGDRFSRWCDYWDHLRAITCGSFDSDISADCRAMLHATARQRAEAFLRTVGRPEMQRLEINSP